MVGRCPTARGVGDLPDAQLSTAREVEGVRVACVQDRLAEAIMLVISGRARYKDERTVAIKSLAPAL